MGISLCKCCYRRKPNRNTLSDNCHFDILLLGQENVGKTEIGYILAGNKRTLFEPTNGVQCYRVNLPNHSLSITEVGGSKDMQKLWHHYYTKTMGLIFCYDMSGTLQEMEKSFQLLNRIASHPFMIGKVVLLVGTKSDLVNDTVQLYDIENTFALESLANRCFSSFKSTYFNPNEQNNLWSGVDWLTNYLQANYNHILARINYDILRENNKKKHETRRKKVTFIFSRPKTAPASLNSECAPPPTLLASEQAKNVFRIADSLTRPETDDVPTTSEIS